MQKKLILSVILTMCVTAVHAVDLTRATIVYNPKDPALAGHIAGVLADDIERVSGVRPEVGTRKAKGQNVILATAKNKALRKLTSTINKTNTTCIFINQLREKIGVMFGNPETTTGGNALKFYASVRLDIRRVTSLKDGDEVVGNQVRVKVVKNKVAPPFRKAEFDIMFGEGISKSGEIVDLGVEYGIIKKSGSWFSYGDTRLAQGRDAAKQVMQDNPELADELEAKIMAAILGNPQEPEPDEDSEMMKD